ncbi:TRAP-type C4-dicarboxylate transport system, small permease component [Paracoccus alcaliphilus]|uniref:TRAP transporter small permease protein n=2 Tax=Paracoccus alcaliphilus TaxID=34002 RepID=A0A1H8NZR0_9RHOB|nr:TRAP-type C4-dicarboxylate transport system, small permease component [Paracoccus alcaliphilus]
MTQSQFHRSRVVRFFDLYAEESIACALIVLMTFCVLLQVFSRYFYDLGVHWTEEVAAYSMVWAVYLGAIVGIRHHFHIRMLLLVQKLPRGFGLASIMLGDVLWMGFNILMIIYASDYLIRLFSFVNASVSLGIEQEWLHSIILIAYVLMSVRVIQVYVLWFRGGCIGLPAREHEADA